MKNLNKATVIGLITKYTMYCVAVGAVALILSGVFESTHITVNWVKLLTGSALLYAVEFTCSWVFKKCSVKKEDN